MSNETIIEILQLPGESESRESFKYDVDTRNSVWVVTFKQRSRIRHHTSRNHLPYSDYYVPSGHRVNVHPGQWLEGKVEGSWSYLRDADHT